MRWRRELLQDEVQAVENEEVDVDRQIVDKETTLRVYDRANDWPASCQYSLRLHKYPYTLQ